MSETMDQRANALWYCLPADSTDEIGIRLGTRLGYKFNTAMVNEVLRYERDNKDAFGWTVPLAKRGPSSKHRYMRVKLNSDGAMEFDRESDRDRLETGLYGTVTHTARMNKHQADAMHAAMKHTRSSKYREFVEALAEDCEALAKKAARVAKIIRLGRDAA